MDAILDLPRELVLGVIFLAGAALGGQLNRGTYRLAWNPRPIGPWSPPDERAPARQWYDRIPVLGWCFLSRESPLHGRAYWIRPLLIELGAGLGLAALYWHEVVRLGALPDGARLSPAALHAQYLSHVVLIALLTVATFIDFDEQTIPDAITVPGTLAGLLLAAALPMSRPVVAAWAVFPPVGVTARHLHLASPAAWPTSCDGFRGLAIALACYLAWWFAIIPWTWTTRRGLRAALMFVAASIVRRLSPLSLAMLFAGIVAILGVWLGGGEAWQSLLSSLVGLAFGGGLIWAVRVVGTRALRQEAMGFGDVTLMAMIGTFLGWQGALIVFFLAPFAAVLVSLAQWLVTGRKDIAFGPYLSVAAVALIVHWGAIWDRSASKVFSLGWLVPAVVVVCLFLMGGMLAMLRLVRQWRSPPGDGPRPDRRRFLTSI